MNRKVMMLGAVGAVAIIALWWVFAYAPVGKQLNDQHTQLAEAQHQTQQLQTQLAQLNDAKSRAPQLARQAGRLSAAVPPTADQADFITSLNDISRSAGILWQSVTFSAPSGAGAGAGAGGSTPAGGGATPTIPVQIQIKGGFFQITDYLNRLETMDRLVIVDGVQIGGGSGSASTPANGITASGSKPLTVTLNARIFTQASTGAAAGTSSAVPNGGGGSGASGTAG
jgi:Tfp pilus assembly protein PilO